MPIKKSTFLFRNLAPEVRGLSLSRKVIFTSLCTYANRFGSCWPSEATLAENAGCNERTVRRALLDLEAHGLIRRRRCSKTGMSGGYVYAIVPPIRLLVRDSGLCALKHPDTKPGHNDLKELIYELDDTGLAVCMDEVWQELEPVVNFQKLREIFSLFPIVEYLLSKSDSVTVQGFRNLPAAAKQLRQDLEVSECKLSGWTQLFPYLTDLAVPKQKPPCPALDDLIAAIVMTGVPVVRARMMLKDLDIIESAGQVEICSRKPARISSLQSQHAQALKQFAQTRRKPVDLVIAGTTIGRLKPG